MTTIAENMDLILRVLGAPGRDRGAMLAPQLAEETGLRAEELSDAVTLLTENGLAEWHRWIGTHPYGFGSVEITARGRYTLEHTGQKTENRGSMSLLSAVPVGSPYGFTDQDWELVAQRKQEAGTCYVTLGRQWESAYYQSELLTKNVEAIFKTAVEQFGHQPGAGAVRLCFDNLAAGYGEHLFNNIARLIIASDIAVFEASDLNPNVMLEMGVALTWGVRVLPIKARGCPRPPSDISGQTWADYEESGLRFPDPGTS